MVFRFIFRHTGVVQNETDQVTDIPSAPFSYSHSTDTGAAATLQHGDSLYSDVYGRMMPSQNLGVFSVSCIGI